MYGRKPTLFDFVMFLGLVCAPLICCGIKSYVNSVTFDVNCGGHIKRAADANSIELAEQELKTALDYMEANGLTEGTTQVLIPSPSLDVGFWYKNIKSSYNDLVKLDTTERNRTDVVNTTLLKLRESLLDHDHGSEEITAPSKIEHYPNVVGMTVWLWVSMSFAVISIVVYICKHPDMLV